MRRKGEQAIVYLDGQPAGTLTVKGWDSSWGFGDFQPLDGFASFAPLYGVWSLLMHADDGDEEIHKLSHIASEELSRMERQIDRIRAELHFAGEAERVRVAQLNIDAGLLEWKEY